MCKGIGCKLPDVDKKMSKRVVGVWITHRHRCDIYRSCATKVSQLKI
jgi:hypothetical protein